VCEESEKTQGRKKQQVAQGEVMSGCTYRKLLEAWTDLTVIARIAVRGWNKRMRSVYEMDPV